MTARTTVTFAGDVQVILPDAISVPTASPAAPIPLAYKLKPAAKATNISEHSLRQSVISGELPARKVGRDYLILHDDLMAFLYQLPVAFEEAER